MDWSTLDERFEWSMAIQNQDVFLGFQYKVEATKYSLFFVFFFFFFVFFFVFLKITHYTHVATSLTVYT